MYIIYHFDSLNFSVYKYDIKSYSYIQNTLNKQIEYP